MRRERVIDVGDAAADRIVGNALGGGEPADAATVDLDIGDLAVVDQLARHVEVVRGLAAGEADLAAPRRKRRIGVIGAAKERFLEPRRVHFFEHADARRRCVDVLAEDLPSIDEERSVGTEALPRRLEVVAIL